MTRRYVKELYSMRAAVETLALARAIDWLLPHGLQRRNGIVEGMRQAAQAEDLTRLVDARWAQDAHDLGDYRQRPIHR